MGFATAAILGSTLIGAKSAGDAADAQTAAGNASIAESRAAREQTAGFFEPYRESGVNALMARDFLLGIGPRPTFGGTPAEITTRTIEGGAAPDFRVQFNNSGGEDTRFQAFSGDRLLGSANNANALNQFRPAAPASSTQYSVGDNQFSTMEEAQAFAAANPVGGQEYGGFTADPGYDFRMSQGQRAVDMSAASRGGLNSGATLKAQTQFGQDFGSNEFANVYNRLNAAAGNGQNAAGAQAANNQFYSGQINNSLAGIGNAQAAGAIGVGNSLQGGISNYFGYMGQQNALSALGGSGQGLFSGNSWG